MREGTSKAVWLLLLKNGGRWSCAEVGVAMRETSLHSILVAIRNLSKGGFITRYGKRGIGDRVTFGVTRNCKIPNGVQLSELMDSGAFKELT